MAKEFYNNFSEHEVDVDLYRVKDEDIAKIAKIFPPAQDYLEDIKEIPVFANKDRILESDYLFLGSPTYFGNVSAEMKAFMDSLSCFWASSELAGKKLVAFSSCATPEGGGGLCLQAINTFAQHMGMVPVSIPNNLIPDISTSAYGLLHFAGESNDRRIDDAMKKSIEAVVNMIV
ncbi:flavodoxin family protein [Fuchsiella alkaliacetigena]|nr:flavodoxin family protein [Fuchsiella alkaliacetigena]